MSGARMLAGALLAGAIVLAACGGNPAATRSGRTARPSTSTTSTTSPPSTTTTTTAPVADTFPVAPLAWTGCGSLQCASLPVPLDYADPGGARITVAVARQPARVPSQRIGSLVINPGGPGGSGIDDLPTELRVLTSTLLDRFDIVSFDPRGVGRSDAVRCSRSSTPTPTPTPALDPAPSSASGQQALLAADRAFGSACSTYSGSLLAHVGTADVVNDLEVLRRALGDPGLTFFGHSYGTYLGARYADAYPGRVRAMVLDGAIDPKLDLTGMVTAQADSFDAQLDAFFQWCVGTSACAWQTGGDPSGRFLALMAQLRNHPLGTAGVAELYDAVLGTMYSTSFWPSLGRALAAAQAGDGSQVTTLAQDYRNQAGPNGQAAFLAITCADHPAPGDVNAYPGLAQRLATSAPVFGPLFAWGELACGVWPAPPSSTPRAVQAAGAPPILVVGTSNDPATPEAWAAALASELQHGVLLVRDGRDHVAYYYSACVRAVVDGYFVNVAPPASGSVCAS